MSGPPLDLFEQPWAMEPSRLSHLFAQLARPEAERAAAMTMSGDHQRAARIGPVSVIPIIGMIRHRPGLESLLGMGTSVEEIRQQLRTEMADQSVRAVILDIDSPGGEVAGIPELATEIRAWRDAQPQKPIIAVANTMAASAAYWLGAQSSEFVVTPSGSVGSVGIYAVHQEGSQAMEKEGIRTTVIGVPDAKTDVNEWTPLSEEARAHIQDRAAAFYGQFVTDVAAGRKTSSEAVEAHYGGGRVLMAKPARAAGMVDSVATLDATIARVYKAVGGATTISRRALRGELTLPELAGTLEADTGETSPAAARLDAYVAEGQEIIEWAQERARLRDKEARPRFALTIETALRSIRDAYDALLAPDDPAPAVAATSPAVDPPAPVAPVPAAQSAPSRFQSDDAWARYLAQEMYQ